MVKKGQAISPFHTMLSTATYLLCVKMGHCVEKGYGKQMTGHASDEQLFFYPQCFEKLSSTWK